MSYEDLKERNIFLPEEHWGELDLASSVNQPLLFLAMVLGIISCTLMVSGGGEILTWTGAVIFLLFLLAFTFVSNAGINRQNETMKQIMKKNH